MGCIYSLIKDIEHNGQQVNATVITLKKHSTWFLARKHRGVSVTALLLLLLSFAACVLFGSGIVFSQPCFVKARLNADFSCQGKPSRAIMPASQNEAQTGCDLTLCWMWRGWCVISERAAERCSSAVADRQRKVIMERRKFYYKEIDLWNIVGVSLTPFGSKEKGSAITVQVTGTQTE